MIYEKLVSIVAAGLLGTALIVSPAQARPGGFHGGGGFVRGPAFAGHGFMGRPAFAQRAFIGRPVFVHRPFVRQAFFARRNFVGPFVGAGFATGVIAAGYSSCWTWVPTNFGWQQVWACNPYWGW
jgi:hypothetical protein